MILIERKKVLHGWRFTLTDLENNEIWVGNVEPRIKDARLGAIKNFIADRKRLIEANGGDAKTLIRQIAGAEKL